MVDLADYLREYLAHRPLFLSLIRAKEAYLYQKYFPLNRPILDVGCGDGYFATVAFKSAKIDVGLDIIDSRVREAENAQIYKKIITYDGKRIPFKDQVFGSAFSNSVLEHVETLDDVLNEVYRVLKPQGIFIAPVIAKPWESYLFGAKLFGKIYQDFMRKIQVHHNLLTKAQWDKVFRQAGFQIVDAIGHIDKKTCEMIDICHYLSVPCLISYTLLGKWVLFPQLSNFYPIRWLSKIVYKNVDPFESAAIFYILKKDR